MVCSFMMPCLVSCRAVKIATDILEAKALVRRSSRSLSLSAALRSSSGSGRELGEVER